MRDSLRFEPDLGPTCKIRTGSLRRAAKFVEQRLGGLQIGGIEALREPAIEISEPAVRV
jgi:hypothetical protein